MKKFLIAFIFSACSTSAYAQAGNLDSTFGINGLVRTAFGNVPASIGRDLILSPDGSFYLLFGVGVTAGGNPSIVHYFSNGKLDSAYGINGYSEVVPTGFSMQMRAIMQADGKIIISGLGRSSGTYDFVLVRLTTDGFLDDSFSGDGKQYTDFSLGNDQITALALQPDGKILAAGYSGALTAIARYNTDGSLDNTFSDDGMQTNAGGIATSVAVQSDGKILITFGQSVARYLQDGTFDDGFGAGGIASFPSPVSTIKSVAVQMDGKIVLGGSYNSTPTLVDFLVIRLNANGILDSSFSDDGFQSTNFGATNSRGEYLALQTDGKILVAGVFAPESAEDIALARYNNDGTPDNSFSDDGKLTTSINQYATVFALGLLSDSRIMVAGYTIIGSPPVPYYLAVRYDVSGNLDPSLDGDGILVDFKPGSNGYFRNLAIQPDGRIVAIGSTSGGGFSIARYNEDGSLDSSFNGSGKQTLSQGTDGWSIKIQANGKIVVAGTGNNGNNDDFVVARINTNGTSDSSFSEDGFLFTDFGSYEVVNDIEIQADGKIVAVGYNSFTYGDFTLARYNSDGTLDNTFSQDGKLVLDLSGNSVPHDLVIQPDGKLVVVGNGFSVLRLNPDGTPDTSFSGDGILIGSAGVQINAVELQKDGKILVAGYVGSPDGLNFLIARLNADGSYDNSFSSGGILNLDFGYSGEYANALTLQPDGKILVGGSVTKRNIADLAIFRLNANGTPDSSFGKNGISVPEIDYGRDIITGIEIFGNRVFAVGITSYGYDLAFLAAFLLSEPMTDSLVVNIPDTFALPNGVELNTVYKGYEPASKLTLVAETSGGTAPYTYKWSNGATTPSIKVGPSVPTTYSVTVTDANGTTSTASKMIKVVDVRCGNKSDKVLICHKEHGHSNRSVTLCVSVYAVWAHLKNGSTLGRCTVSEEIDFLKLFAYPNPTKNYFNLSIKSDETIAAELTVWNVLGKVVERKTVNTNSIVQIGAAYRPGLYFAEVKTKNRKERIKLLKLPH